MRLSSPVVNIILQWVSCNRRVCYPWVVKALVLSAGGMFGAWQAGAWLALESVFQPDLIVGASVGSLNAWMIACGFQGPEIVSIWRSLDDLARLRWRKPLVLRGGLLDTSAIEAKIRQFSEGRRPKVRLGIVCVNMRPPTPVLFQDAEITWRHLAASCAVPALAGSVVLDRKPYIDGGTLGPLPLWAAAKMGATRIVGIDVLSPRPLALRVPQAILRSLGRHDYSLPPEVSLKVIGPRKLLGGWSDAACWDRDRSERWIEEGRQAAETAAEEIREFLR